MTVSIASSLLLWSTLLLPGAKAEPPRPIGPEQMASSPFLSTTMQAGLLDRLEAWSISEANLGEEDSSDGDGKFVASSECWNSLQAGLPGRTSFQRFDLKAFCPSLRSPILRC